MSSWQLAHHASLVPAGDYEHMVLPDNARWGARVIIQQDNGILALLHTFSDRSNWVLAGGGVEAGETISKAAIREAQEEMRITIEIERLMYVRVFHWETPVVEFYVLANIVDGTPQVGHDPEAPTDMQIITDVRVLTFDELENDDDLVFYPIFMRKRIRQDLQTPPTTALYVGTTP